MSGCSVVICHGGAGHTAKDQPGVEAAADAAWALLESGADALEAAVAAVESMENDPALNAGTGSCLRDDGSIQMDAIAAVGEGRFGAVMALQDRANPVNIARLVLEQEFNILAGAGAGDFATSRGFPPQHVEGRARKDAGDTVGALVLDNRGRIAAASSTGGCTGRPAGRVGDTPLWGSGLWCDEQTAVTATGIGEAIMEKVLCFRVAESIKQPSNTLENALEWGLSLFDESIQIGIIALTVDGDAFGLANTGMPWTLRR